jgi:hypothetical protein
MPTANEQRGFALVILQQQNCVNFILPTAVAHRRLEAASAGNQRRLP